MQLRLINPLYNDMASGAIAHTSMFSSIASVLPVRILTVLMFESYTDANGMIDDKGECSKASLGYSVSHALTSFTGRQDISGDSLSSAYIMTPILSILDFLTLFISIFLDNKGHKKAAIILQVVLSALRIAASVVLAYVSLSSASSIKSATDGGFTATMTLVVLIINLIAVLAIVIAVIILSMRALGCGCFKRKDNLALGEWVYDFIRDLGSMC